jgi:hypothetical protein
MALVNLLVIEGFNVGTVYNKSSTIGGFVDLGLLGISHLFRSTIVKSSLTKHFVNDSMVPVLCGGDSEP